MAELLGIGIAEVQRVALLGDLILPTLARPIVPVLEAGQRERGVGAGQEVRVDVLTRETLGFARREIPVPGRCCSIRNGDRSECAVAKPEQDDRGVFDFEFPDVVRRHCLYRLDIAEQEPNLIDVVDEVDENGPAALAPPPLRVEVLGRLEPGGHRRHANGPPEAALVDDLLRAPHYGVIAPLMPHQRRQAGGRGRVADAHGIRERVGDRLFHQHCGAAAEAVDGDVGVHDVRRRNDDGAWLDRGQHPLEVGEPRYRGRLRDTSSVFRRLGNPDQVEPLLLQRTIDVRSADQTGADHGNGYPLHGGLSDAGGVMLHNIKDAESPAKDLQR